MLRWYREDSADFSFVSLAAQTERIGGPALCFHFFSWNTKTISTLSFSILCLAGVPLLSPSLVIVIFIIYSYCLFVSYLIYFSLLLLFLRINLFLLMPFLFLFTFFSLFILFFSSYAFLSFISKKSRLFNDKL